MRVVRDAASVIEIAAEVVSFKSLSNFSGQYGDGDRPHPEVVAFLTRLSLTSEMVGTKRSVQNDRIQARCVTVVR